MEPLKPMTPMQPGPAWWPDELGDPTTSGGQNSVDYAFFPTKRRLAVRRDGKVTLYDSGEHDISGVSQRQAESSSMTFKSQRGLVELDALRRVGKP